MLILPYLLLVAPCSGWRINLNFGQASLAVSAKDLITPNAAKDVSESIRKACQGFVLLKEHAHQLVDGTGMSKTISIAEQTIRSLDHANGVLNEENQNWSYDEAKDIVNFVASEWYEAVVSFDKEYQKVALRVPYQRRLRVLGEYLLTMTTKSKSWLKLCGARLPENEYLRFETSKEAILKILENLTSLFKE